MPPQCQQNAAPVRVPDQKSCDQSHALRGSLPVPRGSVRIDPVAVMSLVTTSKHSQRSGAGGERDYSFSLWGHSEKTVETPDWSTTPESESCIRRPSLYAREKRPVRHAL